MLVVSVFVRYTLRDLFVYLHIVMGRVGTVSTVTLMLDRN